MSDFEDNPHGLGDVFDAYERLTVLGLVSADTSARGVNDAGMQTLADLLAVLTFQTGTGTSQAEKVTSATSRAMLSALGDLFAEIGGQPPMEAQTLQLLTAAVRTARS